MMKHFNFCLNRILVFEFTVTAAMVNVAFNINRPVGGYSDVRVIIRDASDNLISNSVYNTNVMRLDLSTVAGEKKVQLRISNPNNVMGFNMAVNGENIVPVKVVNLDDFRKFLGLETLTIYGDNEFYYLPESLRNLKQLAIYGFNTILSIPATFVNLNYLEIRGNNTISAIPATLEGLKSVAVYGFNRISSMPLIEGIETIDIQGENIISEISAGFLNLKNLALLGKNTLSVLHDWPLIENITVNGLNTVSELPVYPNARTIIIQGNNIMTALPDLSLMPNLSYLHIGGNSEIVYDVADLPDHVKDFRLLSGKNAISYSGKDWPSAMSAVRLISKAGSGMTSHVVDVLLSDLTSVEVWSWPQQIDLRGGNQPRTSASDAAVAYLVSKGVTVLTN